MMGVKNSLAIQNATKQKAMRANVLSGGSQAFMASEFIRLVIVSPGASYPRLLSALWIAKYYLQEV
jgi:hypothetical protein